MEIAHVLIDGPQLRARGTEIGPGYELRYRLDGGGLRARVVGGHEAAFSLDGADFFDLAYSPFFNSLPVLRYGLFVSGVAREYTMRCVAVPELTVEASMQRYEPLDDRRMKFTAGDFEALIVFDDQGLVEIYEGLVERSLPRKRTVGRC